MTTSIFLTVTVVCLFAFLFWREYRHDQERRDLYSRLMARDLPEYEAMTPDHSRPPPESKPRNFVRAGIRKHLNLISQQQEAGD